MLTTSLTLLAATSLWLLTIWLVIQFLSNDPVVIKSLRIELNPDYCALFTMLFAAHLSAATLHRIFDWSYNILFAAFVITPVLLLIAYVVRSVRRNDAASEGNDK